MLYIDGPLLLVPSSVQVSFSALRSRTLNVPPALSTTGATSATATGSGSISSAGCMNGGRTGTSTAAGSSEKNKNEWKTRPDSNQTATVVRCRNGCVKENATTIQYPGKSNWYSKKKASANDRLIGEAILSTFRIRINNFRFSFFGSWRYSEKKRGASDLKTAVRIMALILCISTRLTKAAETSVSERWAIIPA